MFETFWVDHCAQNSHIYVAEPTMKTLEKIVVRI
jgi:hypothetical protein